MKKLILIVLTLIAVFLSFITYGKTSYMEGNKGIELVHHNNINLNRPEPRNNSCLMMKSKSRQNDEWEVVGSWPYGACNTVTADNDHVYIGTGGVIIITDMTDPSNPIEVANYEGDGNFNDVYVKVADFIRDKEDLKKIVRACLKPFIWIASKVIKYINRKINGHQE